MIQFTGLEAQKALLRADLERRISKVVDHGQFIMGPEVGELEDALKSFCGAKHAIAVANGTDALQISLMALNVGRGDAVLVPSFTYTATAEVILVLGARPVFVDVDATTFNIDLDSLRRATEEARREGLNPKAVIAVDLFGLPADWQALNAFAAGQDLHLIADAAQSFGAATADGRKVGALAPVTTASFFPSKPLGCYGDGGAIFTDDDGLAAIMKSIRVHGQGKEKYETVRVGMNSRLDTIQAAVLLSKLTVFGREIEARQRVADHYTGRLASVIETPVVPKGVVSAWAQYTIKSKGRDALQQALKQRGVPTAVYYPKPMHQQQAYSGMALPGISLRNSEDLSRQVLSLPLNPYADEHELGLVCKSVIECLEGK